MRHNTLANRIAVVGLCLSALIAFAFLLTKFYFLIPCVFREITGLYCIGCGAGRSARSLLRFDFISAFTYNPVFFVLLLPLAYFFIGMAINYLVGKTLVPPIPSPPRGITMTIIVLLILFGIFRNIPYYPFTLLAPHGAAF